MDAMRIIRKLLAGAAILGVLLSGASIAATSAVASAVPVVYDAHNDGNWQPYAKPRDIFFGNGAAPFLAGLHWTSWGTKGAWATGNLHVAVPGCYPSYTCTYTTRWAGVWLSTVRTHNGVRYYARMAVEFWRGGKRHWDVGWFKGGYWVFS